MSSDGEGSVAIPAEDGPGPSEALAADAHHGAETTAVVEPVGDAQTSEAERTHVPRIEAAGAPDLHADVERTPGASLIRFVSEPTAPSRFGWFKPSHGAIAAAVALVLGGGFVAGAQILAAKPKSTALTALANPPAETTDMLVRHVQDEIRSLKVGLDAIRASTANTKAEDAIRGLKKSVDTLKGDLETVRAASSGVTAQLGAKIDRLDRDPTPKLAEISARLDRMEKEPSSKLAEIASRLDRLDHEPNSKLTDVTSRLDRIEKQVSSSTTTGSIAMPTTRQVPLPIPAPIQASDSRSSGQPKSASQAKLASDYKSASDFKPAAESKPASEPRSPPKPTTVAGWQLRDVYGGVALLEGRAGGLREVAPGEFVPGVGEIRSIERRGRSWVVVTSRGLIEAENRW